jgi:AraC-like DNA-binding protein/Flp pilus assembly protein TadD
MGRQEPEVPLSGPKDEEASVALPRDLVRALDWLRSHVHEPVQLETLSVVAGVSPRTLDRHFKQFLGTTPLAWVRRMQLSLARRRLLTADREATVTGIAVASGFSQFGRFAIKYRQQFAESPSQTLKRTKARDDGSPDYIDDEAVRLTWAAVPAAHAVAPRECTVALESLARAQELAPRYVLAKAVAAWCWGQRAAHHFSRTPVEDRARASRLAEDVSVLAQNDAMALTHCSGALVLAHRIAEADRMVERALALDPWNALAWHRRGWLSAYAGDCDGAWREFSTALHLTPFYPLQHTAFIGIGCAHFAASRYDRAARWARSGVQANPGSFWGQRIVVAAAVHAGARAEARRIARRLLRKDPDLTVAMARRAWPFSPDFMARLADGLAIAGVPRS